MTSAHLLGLKEQIFDFCFGWSKKEFFSVSPSHEPFLSVSSYAKLSKKTKTKQNPTYSDEVFLK